MKGYGPKDALASPRFAGITTFLRLPQVDDLEGVDLAVVGLPFDTDMNFQTGTRRGATAMRDGSLALRPFYNPAQRIEVFARLSAVDLGDVAVTPGVIESSLAAIEEALDRVHAAGVVPLCLGGDHSVLLAELRSAAKRHGQLGLVLFDAHLDMEESFFGEAVAHETVVQRAVDEGLVDPQRSMLLGMRGPIAQATDVARARDLGFTMVPFDDLAQLGSGVVEAGVERAGKAFVSFDVDFADPAFAPATGTPAPGGPTSAQVLALIRACRGVDLAGADVVGLLAEKDVAGTTAVLAATVAFEILTVVACEQPAA